MGIMSRLTSFIWTTGFLMRQVNVIAFFSLLFLELRVSSEEGICVDSVFVLVG